MMSIQTPETPDEMLRVPGVTKANFLKYGQKLLNITIKYKAEKFKVLSEYQANNIEEYETQSSKPGTSKSSNGWIDADDRTATKSKYFAKKPASVGIRKRKAPRRKKRKSPKKATYARNKGFSPKGTFSGLTQARKSYKVATAFRSPKKYSHMAGSSASTSAAPAKKTTASSGLGLMPLPKPTQRKMNF